MIKNVDPKGHSLLTSLHDHVGYLLSSISNGPLPFSYLIYLYFKENPTYLINTTLHRPMIIVITFRNCKCTKDHDKNLKLES